MGDEGLDQIWREIRCQGGGILNQLTWLDSWAGQTEDRMGDQGPGLVRKRAQVRSLFVGSLFPKLI